MLIGKASTFAEATADEKATADGDYGATQLSARVDNWVVAQKWGMEERSFSGR